MPKSGAYVSRRWDSGTVALIASGPTITQADVDAVHGAVDGAIAVNDGYRLAPWAEMLYSSDRFWWPHYQGVPSFHGRKFSVGSRLGMANPFHGLPDIEVLRNTGESGLELDPTGLRCGRHSGYAAINLAVHLGARRILLLGYTGGSVSGQEHFFGAHPYPLRGTAPKYWDMFRRMYHTMIRPLEEAGVEVLNVTPDSHLTAFPRRALADVLAAAVP